MQTNSYYNDTAKTNRFKKRCYIALVLMLLIIVAIIARLFYLQVEGHHKYTTLSENNILNIIPLAPKRGLIYDRNGVLLANNITTYSLDIIPGKVHNLKKLLLELNNIIPLNPEDISHFKHALKLHHRFDAIPIKLKISEQEIAKFYVNQYRFPGVSIQVDLIREYPFNQIMAPVLGYVGRINQNDLQHVNAANYSANNFMGKVGIERYYESSLHGTTGNAVAEINAHGQIVRHIRTIAPKAGSNIYLTIDSKLQAYAEKILGNNTGSIVAIQPNTGEVLALVSKPSYNPNAFVIGISHKSYQQLLKNPLHPLYNRAIRGLFAPGSTIKPFYALTALSKHIITPQTQIYDPGYFHLPNTKLIYRDWIYFINKSGHGFVNVTKAITVSCDTFFYNLAVKMGIGLLDTTLQEFGFGQDSGIDLNEELPGIIPSPQWKQSHQGEHWYTGDTVITGIGQGFLSVTPLQLAVATATLAEHGHHFKPHLMLKTINEHGQITQIQPTLMSTVPIPNPQAWQTVVHAMQDVITSPYGTAVRFGRHPGYSVAAKTGTAQVYGKHRDEEYVRTNIPRKLRNNHLFISFAPVKQPKIALAIVVEHAGEADKMARQITDFYLHERS